MFRDRSNRRLCPGRAVLTTPALLVLGAASAVSGAAGRPAVQATPRHKTLSAWEQAELGRSLFERTPGARRSRIDYDAAMDRYRLIYHENPRDPNAPDAINAVAELLAEAGRDLHDEHSLRAAVGQYEFLRTQYPGSPLRVTALLAEAQIEANDLHDAAAARERYELFLLSYPRSSSAEQARAGVAALSASAHTEGRPTETADAKGVPKAGESSAGGSKAGGKTAQSTEKTPEPGRPEGEKPAPDTAGLPAPVSAVFHRGPAVQVTGIRHWSTPTYTRVAIDLGGDVEYEAARVPSPDRIFFDLHGTRLAPDLVGKSFTVTDDGFLKRIRVAQSSPTVTRVVLDVNDVTEYSAFLLPDPYRLIVDVHGKTTGRPHTAAVTVDAPATHAATVPNTRAMRAGNAAEVNTLSEQPGKVEATPAPTSQPIATTVAPVPGAAAAEGSGPVGSNTPAPNTGGETAPAGSARSVEPSRATTRADSSVVGVPYSETKSPPAPVTRRLPRHKGATAADAAVVGVPGAPARAATQTADGETSLVRALGLKINRIVIDAGHGGHDSGTLGVGGLEEKDVVLDVALRLGRLLHDRLGAEVIYTRSDDTFIPLETRTAIANKAQADLFLSIHANSSSDASARGVETYYLNFTDKADSLQVAARENAVSGQSIHQLSDLVRKITLRDKLAESREFASDVESSLYSGLSRGNEGLKDRGVKKAPFVVLIGANMPSVLAEISFVTNPRDAAQLRQPEYKERVAESLFRGVNRYMNSLSSSTPAAGQGTERASTGR